MRSIDHKLRGTQPVKPYRVSLAGELEEEGFRHELNNLLIFTLVGGKSLPKRHDLKTNYLVPQLPSLPLLPLSSDRKGGDKKGSLL